MVREGGQCLDKLLKLKFYSMDKLWTFNSLIQLANGSYLTLNLVSLSAAAIT